MKAGLITFALFVTKYRLVDRITSDTLNLFTMRTVCIKEPRDQGLKRLNPKIIIGSVNCVLTQQTNNTNFYSISTYFMMKNQTKNARFASKCSWLDPKPSNI